MQNSLLPKCLPLRSWLVALLIVYPEPLGHILFQLGIQSILYMLQWIHDYTYLLASFNKCDHLIYHIFCYCFGYQALSKLIHKWRVSYYY